MSFSNSDISRTGAAGNAEPSMEEILASIRRILKDEEGGRAAPSAAATGTEDDDVLVLDESMISGRQNVAPAAPQPAPVSPPSSEVLPMRYGAPPPAREVFAGPPAAAQPAMVLPQAPPSPIFSEAGQVHVASEAAPFSTQYLPAPEASEESVVLPASPPEPEKKPDNVAAASPGPAPPPAKLEPKMSEPGKSSSLKSDSLQPPESLISDETSNAAANSIGALVRSMTQDKAVAVARHSMTIEDIVREEIRPLLKAWMDSNLPSLVERVVRTEIERVINRGEN